MLQFHGSLELCPYILLDVLYEDTHYFKVNRAEVVNRFIELDSEPSVVNVPSIGDILGDKLTAFAPNTTGIPYYKNGNSRSTEIMKQVYDIGRLFDAVEDLEITSCSFKRIAHVELGYRNLGSDLALIFQDIRQTAMVLATRGFEGNGDYPLLQDGVKRLGAFIYNNKYYIEDAIVDSAKAAYAATCIEKGVFDINKFSMSEITKDMIIGKKLPSRLNRLKKSNAEAFYYWYLIDNMM